MNVNGINSTVATKLKPEVKVNNQETKPQITEQKEYGSETRVSSDIAMATLGIQKAPSFGGKKKPQDPIKQYVNSLPFADKLSPDDKRNLGNVLRKEDQETDYMKKMIHLVCSNKVNPYATASLCKHGQMSELAKSDIDTYFDKVKGQGMSVEDAFVPKSASQAEGQAKAQVGDVFRVDGQDMIYVKSGDDTSRQLKMDSETYLKLYPPVERFASTQGGTGDCYLLSTINSIMENPYARPAIYDCFTQKGNSVEMQMPNGVAKVLCPDCKLPQGSDYEKYTDGPMGMKLLEHMYGVEFEQKKTQEYHQVMTEEFAKLDKELAKWEKKKPQDNLALKKQKETKAKIANYQIGQQKVENAMQDPKHKLTFVLDDYDNFVMGKFGPMVDDCDKIDPDYKIPSDYYRGGVGGYTDVAISNFGFDAENLEVGVDNDTIDEALFAKNPYDYVIAAGTPPEEAGMESDVDPSYSIYSSHAYKVLPFNDENGNRMFKVTNPWNQSHRVVMDHDSLMAFFGDFAIAKVNPDSVA